MTEAVGAALVTVVTIAGWIWLLGYIYADRRQKRDTTRDNMLWARADERAKLRAEVAALLKDAERMEWDRDAWMAMAYREVLRLIDGGRDATTD